jgi:hypothetical protein
MFIRLSLSLSSTAHFERFYTAYTKTNDGRSKIQRSVGCKIIVTDLRGSFLFLFSIPNCLFIFKELKESLSEARHVSIKIVWDSKNTE